MCFVMTVLLFFFFFLKKPKWEKKRARLSYGVCSAIVYNMYDGRDMAGLVYTMKLLACFNTFLLATLRCRAFRF